MPGPKLLTVEEAMEHMVKAVREAKNLNMNLKAMMTLGVTAEKNARTVLQYKQAFDELNRIYQLATEHIRQYGEISKTDWISLHNKAKQEEMNNDGNSSMPATNNGNNSTIDPDRPGKTQKASGQKQSNRKSNRAPKKKRPASRSPRSKN